jgi:glucose-1-phosphate thymidylyltransferase
MRDGAVDELVAIVLARGLGRRMREEAGHASLGLTEDQSRAAAAGLKGLVPMSTDGRRGRPFLDYLLSGLADVGIKDVAFVIGPEHDALRARYEGGTAPRRLRVSFVIQHKALGTADAVRAAEPFVAGRPFLSLNADNLYPAAGIARLRARRARSIKRDAGRARREFRAP